MSSLDESFSERNEIDDQMDRLFLEEQNANEVYKSRLQVVSDVDSYAAGLVEYHSLRLKALRSFVAASEVMVASLRLPFGGEVW